ncbi:hypothetical protein BGW41_002516 [Actinomortierella wolfii]|nr:hypothetical protein BGW41_002516 [Actinomortierella wolfii]
MTIALWEGMGVIWLTRQRSLICYDEVQVSTMSNTPICGFQGIAIVYLVGALFIQGITLVANLHCLVVYRSWRVQKQVSMMIALSFVLPLVLIIPPALQKQFRFSGYGSICFMSSELVNTYFFYPVGAMMIVSVMIHFSTVIYMIKLYITTSRFESSASTTTSASINSQTKRQLGAQTARDITRMLKQQWRPGSFAMCQKFSRISPSDEWFQQWISCFGQQATQNIQSLVTSTPSLTITNITSPEIISNLGRAGQQACQPIAKPHVPVFWKLVMSDMAPAIFGICIFLIFGSKYELWQEWHRFFSEKVLGRSSNDSETFNMAKSVSGRNNRNGGTHDDLGDASKGSKVHAASGGTSIKENGIRAPPRVHNSNKPLADRQSQTSDLQRSRLPSQPLEDDPHDYVIIQPYMQGYHSPGFYEDMADISGSNDSNEAMWQVDSSSSLSTKPLQPQLKESPRR